MSFNDTGAIVALEAGSPDATALSLPVARYFATIPKLDNGRSCVAVVSFIAEVIDGLPTAPPVWIIEEIRESPQSKEIVQNRSLRVHHGFSVTVAGLLLPVRVYLVPSDGSVPKKYNVAWRYEAYPSSIGQVRETQSRRVSVIPAASTVPVGANDLIQPIGGQYLTGLFTSSEALVGWQPNHLTIRKANKQNDITIMIAEPTGGVPPDFSSITIPPGTAEWSGRIPTGWHGGLRIVNNDLVVNTAAIFLLWERD